MSWRSIQITGADLLHDSDYDLCGTESKQTRPLFEFPLRYLLEPMKD